MEAGPGPAGELPAPWSLLFRPLDGVSGPSQATASFCIALLKPVQQDQVPIGCSAEGRVK